MSKKGKGIFLKESFTDIRSVGTVAASSVFLARVLAPVIHAGDPPRVIVELGMGTGGITQEIIKYIRPQDTFIGIESNEKFFDIAKQNLSLGDQNKPVYLERGFAQNIRQILKKHQVQEADDVICTIPFRVLPKEDTKEILESVKDVLKIGGHFSFIRYLLAPETKVIFDSLDTFKIVHKKIVMRNIPPTEVITMEKIKS